MFRYRAACPWPEAQEHVAQLLGRIRARGVGPDPDIVDDRRMPGLTQVRGTRQKGDLAVGAEIETLKEAEAESVIAREVVHAFLLEHQQAVEPFLLERATHLCDASLVFAAIEMQGHATSSLSILSARQHDSGDLPAIVLFVAMSGATIAVRSDPHRNRCTGPCPRQDRHPAGSCGA